MKKTRAGRFFIFSFLTVVIILINIYINGGLI